MIRHKDEAEETYHPSIVHIQNEGGDLFREFYVGEERAPGVGADRNEVFIFSVRIVVS